jgi:hypothetical protein
MEQFAINPQEYQPSGSINTKRAREFYENFKQYEQQPIGIYSDDEHAKYTERIISIDKMLNTTCTNHPDDTRFPLIKSDFEQIKDLFKKYSVENNGIINMGILCNVNMMIEKIIFCSMLPSYEYQPLLRYAT